MHGTFTRSYILAPIAFKYPNKLYFAVALDLITHIFELITINYPWYDMITPDLNYYNNVFSCENNALILSPGYHLSLTGYFGWMKLMSWKEETHTLLLLEIEGQTRADEASGSSEVKRCNGSKDEEGSIDYRVVHKIRNCVQNDKWISFRFSFFFFKINDK